MTRIVIPYGPRKVFIPYHRRKERWAALVAHRRCGKTVACVNDLIARALQLKLPNGRYAYVAPFLSQGKEIAWEYLKHYARPAARNVNESELWVELRNSSRVRIHGADNPDRLRGAYLDGFVGDEFGDWRPSVFPEVIRPMLADRLGWGTFIGTPKGRNEFFTVYDNAANGFPQEGGERVRDPEWFSAMLKASETGLIPEHELASNRMAMTPEQYDQEFECSFDAAIVGAYYGKEIAQAERDGRVTDVPHDPALSVYTAWDLGKGVNMAVWMFQASAGTIRIINHLEGQHSDGIPDIAKKLGRLPYKWAADLVPHDAKAVEIGTGKTRVEALIAEGRNPRVVTDHNREDGISTARIEMARCWFDKKLCKDGLEALRQYKADFDEKTKAFKNEPKHDWTSHTADAFRYLIMGWRELVPNQPKPKPPTELIFEVDPETGKYKTNMTVYERVMQLARKRKMEEA